MGNGNRTVDSASIDCSSSANNGKQNGTADSSIDHSDARQKKEDSRSRKTRNIKEKIKIKNKIKWLITNLNESCITLSPHFLPKVLGDCDCQDEVAHRELWVENPH
jgi:hypothetical protein